MERRQNQGQESRVFFGDKVTRVFIGVALITLASAGYQRLKQEKANDSQTTYINSINQIPETEVLVESSKSREATVDTLSSRINQVLSWMREANQDPRIQNVALKLLPVKHQIGDPKSQVFAYTDSGDLGEKPFSVTTRAEAGGYTALIGISPKQILDDNSSNQDLAKSLFEAFYVYQAAKENPEQYAKNGKLQIKLAHEAKQLSNSILLESSSK